MRAAIPIRVAIALASSLLLLSSLALTGCSGGKEESKAVG